MPACTARPIQGASLDSREYIKRLQQRDQRAYEALVGEYAQLLWTVAGRYLPARAGFSPEDVEECVSEALFRLWQHPEGFDPGRGSLKTYLCTITKNLAISTFRKRSGKMTVELDESVEQVSLPQSEDAIDYQALYDAIARIPEPSREILMRRYFHEQKPAEIAEAMELPKKEVENRLYRAKKSLSVFLTEDQEDKR